MNIRENNMREKVKREYERKTESKTFEGEFDHE